MLLSVTHSTQGLIVRVKLYDSSQTDGRGLTGLSSASSGLNISTIVDNEATPTIYTTAANNVESITTLGTYAAPTTSKCRFREVDATNHKGVYELQFANARLSVLSSKYLLVSISGATNLAECDFIIQLDNLNDQIDAYVKRDLSAVSGEASRSILNALRFLRNKWAISGGTLTVYKEDDSTVAWTAALTTSGSAEPVVTSDPS